MPSDRRALIFWGGWDGHQPEQVARILARVLEEEHFRVDVRDSMGALDDRQMLMRLGLIVPVWTMGKISPQQLENVCAAVMSGVGIGGCHGGMCDSFREATEWQFMTGGQWVAHPGNDGTRYLVNIRDHQHSITRDIPDFEISSEQYYMHVDPAVKVLATTRFPVADGPHVANGPVDMPVVWTKTYGSGRVFYDSLGHQAGIVESEPNLTIMRRGLLWAARQ
jgi:type 1 glutamine amidotransferase